MLKASIAPTRDSIFETVRQTVDFTKAFPFSGEEREFDGYYRDRCIAPEHVDLQSSLLVFPNGVFCTACGFYGDSTKVWALLNGLRQKDAAEQLLAGDFTLDPDAPKRGATLKTFDESRILAAHFALATDSALVADIEAFGFSQQTIRKARLGVAHVGVEVAAGVYETQQRLVVPVIYKGEVRQILYRKWPTLEQGGDKIRMETGGGAHLYGADDLLAATPNTQVVYVEGWGDVLALSQLVPDVLFCTSTNGAGHWNQRFAELLKQFKYGYVSGDADNAGSKQIERVRRDIPWFKPIRPPAIYKGYDWRDWCNDGGTADEFYGYLRRASANAAVDYLKGLKARG